MTSSGTPPASAEEALARARQHARRALREAVAALRALLDAGSLAAVGAPAGRQPGLDVLARGLDELAGVLDPAGPGPAAPLVEAVADALDQEIGRWESRAARDPEARAVLRAFLGLREILWEFGIRRPEGAAPESEPAVRTPSGVGRPAAEGADDAGDTPVRRRRVQRVRVRG